VKRLAGAMVIAVGLLVSTASVASADVPDIEWPPAGVEPPGHSRDTLVELGYAMSKHLDTAFPAAVPQAGALRWTEWGGELPGVIEDGQDYLTTFAVYEDEIGRTGTSFQIEAPGRFTTSPREYCESAAKCDAEFLADGSLLVQAVTLVDGNRTYHVGSALHYRTDGAVVWVSAYDYDPIWDGDEGPDRDEIALTFEQLSALATDPELHL
jgi:hypothetical protein